MSDDWEEDDNDWDYAGEEFDEEFVVITGGCPECGTEIDVEAEVCPSCGYWLTTAERHTLWDADSPAKGAMSAGKVVLVVILIALMSGLALFF